MTSKIYYTPDVDPGQGSLNKMITFVLKLSLTFRSFFGVENTKYSKCQLFNQLFESMLAYKLSS